MTTGAFSGSAGFDTQPAFGAGGVATLPIYHSANYVKGISGWAIYKNGNVEFNSGVFRGSVTAGEFIGTDFIINPSGEFFYSGTPANGNLIVSIASASGTDSFGNAYPAGFSTSVGVFAGTDFVINTNGAFFYSGTPASGNLIQSLTHTAGTDTFGNAYLAGTSTYTDIGGTFFAINMFGIELSFYTAATTAGPYSRLAGVRFTEIGSNGVLALDATGEIDITAPVNTTDQGTPNMVFPSIWQVDTWHTMTLVGGTTAGTDINGTAYPPSYTMGPDGNTRLRGVLVAGGAGLAAATTFAQILNPDYLPQTNIPVALISNQGRTNFAHVYIRPNGNVQFDSAIPAGGVMYIDCVLNTLGT